VIQIDLQNKPGFKGLGFFLLLATLFLACQQNHQAQKISKTKGSKLSFQELQELYVELFEIESFIQNFPQKVELRKKLLQKSKIKSSKILIAAGFGNPPPGEQGQEIKRRSAEQAAFMDACRWLGYLKLWDKNVETPDFGSLQTNVKRVRKTYLNFSSTNQAEILVELHIE
jgi:hypothetical protein